MSYTSYLQTTGPTWTRRTNGSALMGAIGASLDQVVGFYKQGIALQFPGLAGKAADALALTYLGDEIGMPKNGAESYATYGERLRRAWQVWPWAGTALGMLLALEGMGYGAQPGSPVSNGSQPIVVQQARYGFVLDTNTNMSNDKRLIAFLLGTVTGEPGWAFDANGGLAPHLGLWHRFGVIFQGVLPAGWGGPPITTPPTSTSTPSKNEVNALIAMVQKWKPAKAYCFFIEAIVGNYWGAAGLTWGGGQNWGGGSATVWSGTTPY